MAEQNPPVKKPEKEPKPDEPAPTPAPAPVETVPAPEIIEPEDVEAAAAAVAEAKAKIKGKSGLKYTQIRAGLNQMEKILNDLIENIGDEEGISADELSDDEKAAVRVGDEKNARGFFQALDDWVSK